MAKNPARRAAFSHARKIVRDALAKKGAAFAAPPSVPEIGQIAWRHFDNGRYTHLRSSASRADAHRYLVCVAVLLTSGKWDPDAVKKAVADAARTQSKKVPKPPAEIKTRPIEGMEPASDGFLSTWAWRTLRYRVITKRGNKCECCGAGSAQGRVINVDHVKPRKTHPHLALSENNLQILCDLCNAGKGNWDSTDWRGTSEAAE